MKKLILFFFLMSFLQSFSQQKQQYSDTIYSNYRFEADFGFGYGLIYGGYLGAQLQYLPHKHFAIFGSGGGYFAKLGWQIGTIGYLTPKITSKPVRVYATFMYGTNAAVFISPSNKLNKTFLGPTFGVGFEMRMGKTKKHGFNIDILFPIRSDEFYDYEDRYPHDVVRVFEFQEPILTTISIGYHFEMK